MKYRVDKVLPHNAFETVAWFVFRKDAIDYVQEFATDPLNTQFDFRVIKE